MTTHQRGNVCIVTLVEELAAGRYRGTVTFDGPAGQWKFYCEKCRTSPSEALNDATSDVEFAYRRYLTERCR
ncbi:hypothetical protein HpMS107_33780 [Helicobacter pylori]|jgi:hypothetical protein